MRLPTFLGGVLLGVAFALAPALFADSTSTDAISGVSTSTAIKAPVRSVVTSNITTSGLSSISTIDGSLTPAANDRFLLTGQTSGVDNGIYVAASGAWSRATDFDGSRDARDGTMVPTQNGSIYYLTTSDPISIGTSSLSFSVLTGTALSTNLASTSASLGAALVGINDAGGYFSGSNVEAVLQEFRADAELAPIMGVTSAADRLFYYTGSGAGSLATFTAFGRSLVDDATASAGRVTLKVHGALAQSSVAVSGGADTNENILATVTISADALGANGCVEIEGMWTGNNDASVKTGRIRFGGIGGTIYATDNIANNVSLVMNRRICNRNATNSQLGSSPADVTGYGSKSTNAFVTSAVDTTATVDIVFTVQKADSADTMTLEGYRVYLLPSP
jgi:hypothetical protein